MQIVISNHSFLPKVLKEKKVKKAAELLSKTIAGYFIRYTFPDNDSAVAFLKSINDGYKIAISRIKIRETYLRYANNCHNSICSYGQSLNNSA